MALLPVISTHIRFRELLRVICRDGQWFEMECRDSFEENERRSTPTGELRFSEVPCKIRTSDGTAQLLTGRTLVTWTGDGLKEEHRIAFDDRRTGNMGHEGKNLSGFERVCGACQKRIKPFVPDNITVVDCCGDCWAKLGVAQRLAILQAAKQVHQLSILANTVAEHIRSGDALRGKLRRDEEN